MTTTATIRIQEADFDIAHEIAALTRGRSDVGAIVTFSGICRGSENGEPIAALTLGTIPAWRKPENATHRRGNLALAADGHQCSPRRAIPPGENIVLVLALRSTGRRRFRRPNSDGLPEGQCAILEARESAKGTSWIEARGHDDDAAARWTKS
jgi:molybdopterin synthase catalytic subunit